MTKYLIISHSILNSINFFFESATAPNSLMSSLMIGSDFSY